MAETAKPPIKRYKEKPPVPKFHYKLVTVTGSQAAGRMETALQERLAGRFGVSLFSICHANGACDVMGDSGKAALAREHLKEVRAIATQIRQA